MQGENMAFILPETRVFEDARNHFNIGDVVTLSSEGRLAFYHRKSLERRRKGIVVGFGREKYLVRVLWDGLKRPESIAWWYLRRVKE